ncbi:MAG: hypothetical protein HYV26_12830 [Candidatus Hydrogenedentes bacterium]|nr:hypothetical protein [Candidatus Hydrogenedentota bacterium]
MTLVVSIGVFAPWYYRNIGFYYDFWVESHQGGQGGPLVRFNEDEARAPEALDKSSALAPPAPEPPHEFQAASSGLGLENVFPLLLQTLGQTAADNPLIAEKLLHPRVPWIRYPVHLLNNGLFLPLFLLSVAGILCACCNPKFRNSTVLVLLLCLLGSWVLLTVPIKYSNPRYALPAVPALVLFAAPAIFSIPHLWLRRTLAGITMVLLIVQYVHLSFVTLCGVHRADLAMNADPGIQGIFQDPGLVVFKDEMIISDAFSPVGHPVKENYVDRLFASLVRAEFQQPFVTGPYANFQRLNFRGLELHQRHYWPSEAGDAGEPPRPNPFLRPDLPPEQIPKRRLRSVGMGAEPEHLIPRLGITDYIVYAIEPKQVQEAKEQQWLKFFEENGFVLFDRFEVPAFGRVPQRTFGLMMRKPEGELIQITRTEDIDSLSLFDLHGFVHSPEFAELPADLKQHALARFEELVRPNQPFLVMNESVSLVKLSVGKAEEGWYEMRMLFKTTASIDKDYRVYFQGAPLDPQYLPEEKKGQGYIDWNFNPVPPTSEWKPDDYVLLRRRFEAHPVPYNFVVGFFQPPNTAFGQPAQTQMDLGRLSQ